MTRTRMLAGLGVVVLVVGVAIWMSQSKPGTGSYTIQTMEPVDAQLAAKAEESCWFKVKNRSSRADQIREWQSVTSTGARTERLGELLMVTGAMEPSVRGEHFYGCSLFQYTEGSPVVMTASTAAAPIRADAMIPFGFSHDGKKQQQ